jgi:hypothetical protein
MSAASPEQAAAHEKKRNKDTGQLSCHGMFCPVKHLHLIN